MSSDEQLERKDDGDAPTATDQTEHLTSSLQRFEVVRGELAGWDLRPCDGQESLSNHTCLEDALVAAALRGEATEGDDFLIVVRPRQTATLHRQHEDLLRPTLVLLAIGLLVFAFIGAFAVLD